MSKREHCYKEYEIDDGLLKKGGQGKIRRVCKQDECVVLKSFPKKYTDLYKREIHFLKKLQREGISVVPFGDSWMCEGKGYITMMEMQGDLTDFLKEGTFPKTILDQCVRILESLSANRIIHGDVKFDNFLYQRRSTGSIKVVISDLASSITLNPTAEEIKMGYDRPYGHTWIARVCPEYTKTRVEQFLKSRLPILACKLLNFYMFERYVRDLHALIQDKDSYLNSDEYELLDSSERMQVEDYFDCSI